MSVYGKEAELRRMKRFATFLLLIMTAIFIISCLLIKDYPFIVPIKAFSEAAMVGALADWFAVTALFRHPFGVKFLRFIPLFGPILYRHSAIIPTHKDRLGEALGDFVETHFLNPEKLSEKLKEVDVTSHIIRFLQDKEKREELSEELSKIIYKLMEHIEEKGFPDELRKNMQNWLLSVDFGPIIIHIFKNLILNNKHQELLTFLITILRKALHENITDLLKRSMSSSSHSSIPIINEALTYIFVKFFDEKLREVQENTNHSFRQKFEEEIYKVLTDMMSSESWKGQVQKTFREAMSGDVTDRLIEKFLEALSSKTKETIETTEFKTTLMELLFFFSMKLEKDKALREKINDTFISLFTQILKSNSQFISQLIADEVRKWDTETATEMIELEVGKDLQYIRINGTILGGIIGLLIYLFSLIFS